MLNNTWAEDDKNYGGIRSASKTIIDGPNTRNVFAFQVLVDGAWRNIVAAKDVSYNEGIIITLKYLGRVIPTDLR